MSALTRSLSVLILFFAISDGFAQQLEKVYIHGFGSWGYGRTDSNKYLFGVEGGEYDYLDFALAVTAKPKENLQVKAQLYWNADDDGTEAAVDYAFAEWRFSDILRLRIGQVKHPFGIYGEIFDVGILRPFFALPSSVYNETGISAEAYKGAGFTGFLQTVNDWGLGYDIYVGELNLDSENPIRYFGELNENEEGFGEEHNIKDILGGRVTIDVPIDGLKLGISGYSGKEENTAERHSVYGVHGEYLSNVWSVRSEYYRQIDGDELKLNAFYFEMARKFSRNWQIAARLERLNTVLPEVDTREAPSLLKHRENVIGINYWFNSYFVLKLSYHHVDGNRFAKPEALDAALLNHTLKEQTDLFIFGAQFAF